MKKILTFKLLLLITLAFVLGISACKKNEERLDEQSVGKLTGQLTAEGTVKNTGDPAYDGCGWLIRIGDKNYSPTNLANNYKENELKVSIRYETLTSKYLCGLLATPIPHIKILEIEKK
jgi:hypothetical protein